MSEEWKNKLKRPKYDYSEDISCEHEFELYRRKDKNGRDFCQELCQNCGESNGIKPKPDNINDLNEITDGEIGDRRTKYKYNDYWVKQTLKEADREFWFFKYGEYLKTYEWKNKRELVLKRDEHICRGCLNRNACHVHHTTYENVGDEFLFELISLCKECHEKIHPHMREGVAI